MTMQNIWRSFVHACRGVLRVWKEEHMFRVLAIIFFVLSGCMYYFGFNYVDYSLVLFAFGVVLAAECMNTAVEDLCNKVEPNHNSAIGVIKDMMSAAVLFCCVGSAALILAIFAHHF
jgi:diacylglycerol kinase